MLQLIFLALQYAAVVTAVMSMLNGAPVFTHAWREHLAGSPTTILDVPLLNAILNALLIMLAAILAFLPHLLGAEPIRFHSVLILPAMITFYVVQVRMSARIYGLRAIIGKPIGFPLIQGGRYPRWHGALWPQGPILLASGLLALMDGGWL